MTAPINPPIIAKAALVTARTVDKAFAVPMDMTNGALAVAGSTHSALGAINAAAAEGYHALVPRGPAKLLEKLFAKVDQSIVGSAAQAKQATTVFWAPFSEGSVKTGTAVSNPFTLFYANRAGFELPADSAEAQKLLSAIAHPDPYVRWPTKAAEEAPAPEKGGDTKPEGDAGSETKTDPGTETKPGGETRTEGDAKPEGDTGGEPKPEGDAGGQPKPEGDAGTTGAETKPEGETSAPGAGGGAAAVAPATDVPATEAPAVAANAAVADAAAGATATVAPETSAAPSVATA